MEANIKIKRYGDRVMVHFPDMEADGMKSGFRFIIMNDDALRLSEKLADAVNASCTVCNGRGWLENNTAPREPCIKCQTTGNSDEGEISYD